MASSSWQSDTPAKTCEAPALTRPEQLSGSCARHETGLALGVTLLVAVVERVYVVGEVPGHTVRAELRHCV